MFLKSPDQEEQIVGRDLLEGVNAKAHIRKRQA